ncbi:unnamed protein product [Gordionus sp. m RMFG-2023]
MVEFLNSDSSKITNLNIGILGHVDSGKTSLAKIISSTPSTACFDKNTQSQERGITIDLGFSSLQVDMPSHLKSYTTNDKLQFTFVDCPGHASLIKTIIGGSQIIDMMLLVIDCQKGIQTQTAECIVIGEITCQKGIVILNKVDLYPIEQRKILIQKMVKKLQKTFQNTKFKDSPIVSLSITESLQDKNCEYGINNLIETLKMESFIPYRDPEGPFIMNVDHCFNIKGQGTILTGTMLAGHIAVNEELEIPDLSITRKIKSIQMYKRPVKNAIQGDRIGVCLPRLDITFERGYACSPLRPHKSHSQIPLRHLNSSATICVSARRIRHFRGVCNSDTLYHVSIGHVTRLAKARFLEIAGPRCDKSDYDDEIEYMRLDGLENNENGDNVEVIAILSFSEGPVLSAPGFLYIASRLDSDDSILKGKKNCRIAFCGRILNLEPEKLIRRTFKLATRVGLAERMLDETRLIVSAMFRRESARLIRDHFAGFDVEFYSSAIENGHNLKLDDILKKVLEREACTSGRDLCKKNFNMGSSHPIGDISNDKRETSPQTQEQRENLENAIETLKIESVSENPATYVDHEDNSGSIMTKIQPGSNDPNNTSLMPICVGKIESAFGQSGKVIVRITSGSLPEALAMPIKTSKKGAKRFPPKHETIHAILRFKRYLNDVSKKPYPIFYQRK